MERKGPIRPKQSGGSGCGLSIPPQIHVVEPKILSLITSEILQLLIKTKSQTERHLQLSEPLNRRNLPQKLQHLEVLEESLLWRMFILRNRKDSEKWQPNSMTTYDTLDGTAKLREADDSRLGALTLSRQHLGTGRKNTFLTNSERVIQKNRYTYRNRESMSGFRAPVIQFIPRLPNLIEDVVRLWRKGERDHFHSVYIFDSAEQRRRMIFDYSDRLWRESGQKAAFFKFKELITVVAQAHGDLDIFEVQSENWTEALYSYQKKYNFKDEVISLSLFFTPKRFRKHMG